MNINDGVDNECDNRVDEELFDNLGKIAIISLWLRAQR